MNTKKITLSSEEISKLFNLTRERLRQLADSGHFPKPERGRWDVLAVASGLVEHLQDRLRARKDTPEFLQARQEKMTAESKLATLALEQKQGKVVSREAVEKVWAARKTALRQVIDQMQSLTKKERARCLEELELSDAENYVEKAREK